MKKHLAFDLGASSGRAIVGWIEDGKLRLEEVHRFVNHPMEMEPDHFHWDFTSLVHEIETGLQKAFAFAEDMASFSIDTWGVDVVFFRDGKPIRQPNCYRNSRFNDTMDHVHKDLISGQRMYEHTGIQLMPFNTVYQLYTDFKEHPEDFGNGAKMLFMPDALLYMLTGDDRTEYTIASTGALLDPETRQWKRDLLQKLGIPDSVLTELVPPCTLGKQLKQDVCERLGIPRIPCVKCGSHDTASAVAALPAQEIGNDAYISLGTWALLGAELLKPNLSAGAFQAHYTNEGGLANTIRFLTNITGTWLLQETRRTWNESGENISFAQMCDLAQTVTTDKRIDPNHSAFSLPGDIPTRIMESFEARNQEKPASRAELLRCIYESLADCFRSKLRELESLRGSPYQKLHILGGGTKDDFLMQLTSNKIGVPVIAGPVEATAIGNLLAQFLASGEISSLREGRALVARSFELKTYEPEKI